jgi:hypothetical protein
MDIEGQYVLAGTTPAALGIVRDGVRCVVTLSGGSPGTAVLPRPPTAGCAPSERSAAMLSMRCSSASRPRR